MNKIEKMPMEESASRGQQFTWFWILVLIVAAVIGVLWWTGNLGNIFGENTLSKPDTYQAVFLTNDQVYFGRLSNLDSQYPRLTDVFYLQVTQTLQPIGEVESNTPQQNINLVKLGGELHGPLDEMAINRDHILFVEDMKDDSQVVTAIKQYKESQ